MADLDNLEVLKTPEEIAKYYDFLFSTSQGEGTFASIWGMYYRNKKTKALSGKKGYVIPPNNVFSYTGIPIIAGPGEKIDLELSFYANGFKAILIEGLENKKDDTLFSIEDIFNYAIASIDGTISTAKKQEGFVLHQFKNQDSPKKYKVTRYESGLFQVESYETEGERTYWKPQDTKSPRTKSIINQFNKDLKNGTLKTEFANLSL